AIFIIRISWSRQWPDHNIIIINNASEIVSLQADCSFRMYSMRIIPLSLFSVFVLGIVHYHSIVDLNNNPFTLYLDVLGIPFIIIYIGFHNIHHIVQATGTFPIALGIVYLYLITVGGPSLFLILRMDIDPGIRLGLGHNGSFEFKILKLMVFHIAHIIEMSSTTGYLNGSVLYGKGRSVLAHFPSIQIFAIKQGNPTLIFFTLGTLTYSGVQKGKGHNQNEQIL